MSVWPRYAIAAALQFGTLAAILVVLLSLGGCGLSVDDVSLMRSAP